jgi:lysophospholipase L1-like esterase
MKNWIPLKAALVILLFGAILLLPQVFPSLSYYAFDPRGARAVVDFPLRKSADDAAVNPLASEASLAELRTQRLAAIAPKNLIDPAHALDHFYDSLQKGGVTRVLHYGDSPTTADLITADVRILLQKEFGNAGTGFVLIARPWAWYNRRGVEMSASNWKIDIGGNSPLKDGLHGLGAVSFRGGPEAVARWTLKDPAHRSVEVYYLGEPAGGEFTMEADDRMLGTASAMSEHVAPGFARFDIPEGASHLTLRVTGGSVRFYGVDFRRPDAGVVYTSAGINGANITLLSRALNEEHWAEELRHYNPDLVVINYGTNESGFPHFVDSTWGREMRLAIHRLHAALPNASLLLMSPMDRGERKENGEIDTLASIPRLVNTEAQIALDMNVAFFNTFEAMGGQGTMARWYAAEPRLVGADYIHPMPAGAKIVGELLFSALRDGFQQHKAQELKQKIAESGAVTPVGRP